MKKVVFVLGVITGFAVCFLTIPLFRLRETSRTNACVGNLRQIEAAKEQIAMRDALQAGDAVPADWIAYMKGRAHPACPSGGTYTTGRIGDLPECSIQRHTAVYLESHHRRMPPDRPGQPPCPPPADWEKKPERSSRDLPAAHQKWVAKVLEEIQSVKVGMTRQDLLKVFTTEGGISTRRQRTFVHRECRYIKVDVQFKPVGQEDQKLIALPEDQITAISRPYLAAAIID